MVDSWSRSVTRMPPCAGAHGYTRTRLSCCSSCLNQMTARLEDTRHHVWPKFSLAAMKSSLTALLARGRLFLTWGSRQMSSKLWDLPNAVLTYGLTQNMDLQTWPLRWNKKEEKKENATSQAVALFLNSSEGRTMASFMRGKPRWHQNSSPPEHWCGLKLWAVN